MWVVGESHVVGVQDLQVMGTTSPFLLASAAPAWTLRAHSDVCRLQSCAVLCKGASCCVQAAMPSSVALYKRPLVCGRRHVDTGFSVAIRQTQGTQAGCPWTASLRIPVSIAMPDGHAVH